MITHTYRVETDFTTDQPEPDLNPAAIGRIIPWSQGTGDGRNADTLGAWFNNRHHGRVLSQRVIEVQDQWQYPAVYYWAVETVVTPVTNEELFEGHRATTAG